MLRAAGSVFSFLTIIPSPGAPLDAVARNMFLFPLAGMAVGLLAGSLGFGLSLFLDPLLTGLLVTAFLAVITGIHHADGLADFADGLMARGTREKKLRAMRDVATGSAGTAALVLCMAGLTVAVSLSGGTDLLIALLVSEVLAKFSMVLMASLARPAAPGSASAFVGAMKDRKRLLAASALMIVPVVLAGGPAGLAVLGVAVAVTLFLLAVSARSFGGVTGDVLGAANELVRLASLAVFVSL